jgi:mannose-6-phosphate isomerase-like protein (cupin superfamily)
MSAVVHRSDSPAWQVPVGPPETRIMGVMFERDITPTQNIAPCYLLIPAGHEQPKLSRPPGVEEIYYVVRGSGTFILGDEHIPVRPGSAVYVAPDTEHRAINESDVEMEMLWFNSPSAFGPVSGYHDLTAAWTDVRGKTHPADAT